MNVNDRDGKDEVLFIASYALAYTSTKQLWKKLNYYSNPNFFAPLLFYYLPFFSGEFLPILKLVFCTLQDVSN